MTTFAESLPTGCPPADAVDEELDSVFRLVANNPPTEFDFASKNARGEDRPDDMCPCVWASCSLFEKARSLRKYTRLRIEFPFLAELKLPEGLGLLKRGDSKRGHVDFWRYTGSSLPNYVVNVEGPENDH